MKACFLPGTLALGTLHGLSKSWLTYAEEVAYTCYLTFARQPTHLAAEITYFNTEESELRFSPRYPNRLNPTDTTSSSAQAPRTTST